MKGIILAGGSGTRLHPTTSVVSKQLLSVYDKPMIYYPLSILMLAQIKEILIISTEESVPAFKKLLSDGSDLGIKIEYAVQKHPNGIAEAFIIAEDFIKNSPVALILGDNIFYGQGIVNSLIESTKLKVGSIIFGYHVHDPKRYGVVEIEQNSNKVLSIEEKPKNPKSNIAITGLYFFDNSVVEKTRGVTKSARGEMEIISVISKYLDEDSCNLKLFGRGIAWLDTGTHDSLLEASNFIATIEKRQGYKIACIEEIAYRLGYIDKKQALILAEKFSKSGYGDYIKMIVNENDNKIIENY